MKQSLVVYAQDREVAEEILMKLVNAGFEVGLQIRPVNEEVVK